MLIERLESELAILQTQVDSCHNLIAEYQYEIAHSKDVYNMYDALIEQKNVVLALDEQQIKLLKRQAKLLRIKLIATGVALPVAGAGAAAGITFLVMTLRK